MEDGGPGADLPAPTIRRLRFHVEYDGTGYNGWQAQIGQPTIQEEIEKAFEAITRARSRVVGAGRTDTGVHAAGQVAHVDTPSVLPVGVLERGVNALLPASIALCDVGDAPRGFHARHSATSRTYRYRIVSRPERSPLRARTALHVGAPLDAAMMARAARLLEGEHDFRCFGAAPGSEGGERTTRRTVVRSLVERRGDEVLVTVTANAFLTHMMRCIARLLIEVGRGRSDLGSVVAALGGRDARRRSLLALPHGLCLVAVDYGETSGPFASAGKGEDFCS